MLDSGNRDSQDLVPVLEELTFQRKKLNPKRVKNK